MEELKHQEETLKNQLTEIQQKISSHPSQIDNGRKIFTKIFGILDIQFFLDNMVGFDDCEDLIDKFEYLDMIADNEHQYHIYNFNFPHNILLSFNMTSKRERTLTTTYLKQNNTNIIWLFHNDDDSNEILFERLETSLEKHKSDSITPFLMLLKNFFKIESETREPMIYDIFAELDI